MDRLSDNAIDIIDELHTERLHYFSEYLPLIDAANLLAEYEDTGLTPQDIEQMKARMPLHQWAGESPEKMSIFGVPVAKIIELIDAEKQGKFVILPCEIGDTVYRVCKKKYDVDGYGMQWEEDWGIVTNSFHLGMFHEIGKNVFLTRKEAEDIIRSK